MRLIVRINQTWLWFAFRLYLLVSGSDYRTNIIKNDIDGSNGYILASNHQSKLDPFVIGGALPFLARIKLSPVWFMGYRELFANGVASFLLRSFGTFPNRPIKDLPYGLEFSETALRNQDTVCIFPEGRRTKKGETEPKHGVSVLADMDNVKLIPVHVSWRPGLLNKVSITIGKPMDAAGLSPREIMDIIYKLPRAQKKAVQ